MHGDNNLVHRIRSERKTKSSNKKSGVAEISLLTLSDINKQVDMTVNSDFGMQESTNISRKEHKRAYKEQEHNREQEEVHVEVAEQNVEPEECIGNQTELKTNDCEQNVREGYDSEHNEVEELEASESRDNEEEKKNTSDPMVLCASVVVPTLVKLSSLSAPDTSKGEMYRSAGGRGSSVEDSYCDLTKGGHDLLYNYGFNTFTNR